MSERWLTSCDPEPPPGSTVETEWGQQWTRLHHGTAPCSWVVVGHEDGEIESWTKVAGNYGPVKAVDPA